MQLSDYRVKLTQAQSSMEEIESRKDEADAAALELQEEIKAEQENQAQSARTLAALNSRIEENTNALNGFNLKLKGKTDKAQQLKTRLDQITSALSEKRSRAKMLSDLEKNMEG